MADETKSQSAKELEEVLSTEKWLLSVGLVPESVQQNLIGYGFLSSEDAIDVEATLDVEKKAVFYQIFLDQKALKKYTKFRKRFDKYKGATSLFGKWMLLRTIKKNWKINVQDNLTKFIRDYLPRYTLTIEVKTR